MLTLTTNGRSLRGGIETIGRDRFQVSRENIESLGREGLRAGREGLHAGREGLQAVGGSVAELTESLPLRPKRRRRLPLIAAIAVAIAGAVAIAIIAGLQTRRDAIGLAGPGSKSQGRFDNDAADRAADKDMDNAVGASAADDLVGRSDHRTRSEYYDLGSTAGT